MKIENGKKITLEFELRNKDGNLLDKTTKGDEFTFIFGEETMIPGLEEVLLGRTVGDKFKAKIAPNKGYGNYDEELVEIMNISDFEGLDIYEGMEFEANTDEGVGVFTIKEIEEDKVIVDGNHPFAGMTLVFTGKVLKIEDK